MWIGQLCRFLVLYFLRLTLSGGLERRVNRINGTGVRYNLLDVNGPFEIVNRGKNFRFSGLGPIWGNFSQKIDWSFVWSEHVGPRYWQKRVENG